jgi:hypothetical protein
MASPRGVMRASVASLEPAATPALELVNASLQACAIDGVGGRERAGRKFLAAREIRW